MYRKKIFLIYLAVKIIKDMNIYPTTKENIKKAAEIIRSGGLVAFPTETVYGLGADGLNPIAAAKIFEVKERPAFNPLILHIADLEQFYELTNIHANHIEEVIHKFWPGALTLVVPKKDIVPEIITSGQSYVAVRMPDHPVALELIRQSKTPIAAPSANKFSMLSPTSAKHVKKQLGDNIDMILDGGPCKIGVESTIIKVNKDSYELLRPGGIELEQIEKVVGKVIVIPKHKDTIPVAPGMLPYHYAPETPLDFLTKTNLKKYEGKKIGALFFKENKTGHHFGIEKILSPGGNLKEASANLFAYLHELENERLDVILTEKFPDKGLGRAIMDRLNKAANKQYHG